MYGTIQYCGSIPSSYTSLSSLRPVSSGIVTEEEETFLVDDNTPLEEKKLTNPIKIIKLYNPKN
jgi:hypothetical protein